MREARANGRDYLVLPVVMLRVGIHRGSEGPILYTQEELALSVSLWEGKPVTNGHPMHNGNYVNAQDQHRIGVVASPRMSRDALVADAWLDLALTPSSILSQARSGKRLEVSTGLGMDFYKFKQPKGREYFVSKNYRPDHLAILMDQRGACSVTAGCGLNVA